VVGWTYLRPADAEFLSCEAVGNTNWTWSSLLPYFRKSENLQIPSAIQAAQGATYDALAHGFNGPLEIAWPPLLEVGKFGQVLNQTWQSLGLTWNHDSNAGMPRGLFLKPSEYNLEEGAIREDANRAYLSPTANRTNLKVYTHTTAMRLRLEHNPTSKIMIATGVDVVSASGKKQTIQATQEIVLSLGALRTPALLEASGIGYRR
jgi:choline dehydrogenase-like flavoprotein